MCLIFTHKVFVSSSSLECGHELYSGEFGKARLWWNCSPVIQKISRECFIDTNDFLDAQAALVFSLAVGKLLVCFYFGETTMAKVEQIEPTKYEACYTVDLLDWKALRHSGRLNCLNILLVEFLHIKLLLGDTVRVIWHSPWTCKYWILFPNSLNSHWALSFQTEVPRRMLFTQSSETLNEEKWHIIFL